MRLSMLLGLVALLPLVLACASVELAPIEALRSQVPTATSRLNSDQDLRQRLRVNGALLKAQKSMYMDTRCGALPSKQTQDCDCPGYVRPPEPPGQQYETYCFGELTWSINDVLPAENIARNHLGGDPGGLLTNLGDYLVAMHNQRLSTLRIAAGVEQSLEVVDQVDLKGELGSAGGRFHKLLRSRQTLILSGITVTSDTGAIAVFELDENGQLVLLHSYHLRSDAGGRFTGYSPRIRGDDLVFNVEVALHTAGQATEWPQWSKAGGVAERWQTLVNVGDLYFSQFVAETPVANVVLRCPIAGLVRGEFDCHSSGIVADRATAWFEIDDATYMAVGHVDAELFGDSRFHPSSLIQSLSVDERERQRRTSIYRLSSTNDERLPAVTVPGRIVGSYGFRQVGDQLYLASVLQLGAYKRPTTAEVNLHRVALAAFDNESSPRADQIAQLRLDNRANKLRLSDEGLWVATAHENYVDSAPYQPPLRLYFQDYVGGMPKTWRTGIEAWMLEPLGDQMLALGEFSPEQRVSLISWTQTQPPMLEQRIDCARCQSGQPELDLFGIHQRPDGAHLIAWPMMSEPIADDSEPAGPFDLYFVHAQTGGLVDLGRLSMSEATQAAEDADVYAWYGTQTLTVGDRSFALSADLIKEVSLGDGHVQEIRQSSMAPGAVGGPQDQAE